MRLVCISDTHGQHRRVELPAGDVLIHAGDITLRGNMREVEDFAEWLAALPYRRKIVIAGNHDFCFQDHRAQDARAVLVAAGGTYLQDSGCVIDGKKFYGSPWQPWFMGWAFNLQRGSEIKLWWDRIPSDVDVLITHGPPYGHGDRVGGEDVGCEDLLDAIQRVRPKYHIFGHIHEGYGKTTEHHGVSVTTCVNVCTCDARYRPVNAPVVLKL